MTTAYLTSDVTTDGTLTIAWRTGEAHLGEEWGPVYEGTVYRVSCVAPGLNTRRAVCWTTLAEALDAAREHLTEGAGTDARVEIAELLAVTETARLGDEVTANALGATALAIVTGAPMTRDAAGGDEYRTETYTRMIAKLERAYLPERLAGAADTLIASLRRALAAE